MLLAGYKNITARRVITFFIIKFYRDSNRIGRNPIIYRYNFLTLRIVPQDGISPENNIYKNINAAL